MQCTTLEDVEIFLFPGKRRRRGGPLGIYSSQARAPHPFSIDILLHILTDFERDTSICSRASIAHVAPGKAAATLTRTELEISSSSSPFWVVSLSLSCALSLFSFPRPRAQIGRDPRTTSSSSSTGKRQTIKMRGGRVCLLWEPLRQFPLICCRSERTCPPTALPTARR